MSLEGFVSFDQPLAAGAEGLSDRTVINIGRYNLLNNLSGNTNIGVVDGDDRITGDNDKGKILQIAGDYCMDLYVYRNTFSVRTYFDESNDTYVTKIRVEYTPAFKDRNARVVHDLTT